MLVFIVFAKLVAFTYAASELFVYPTILEERTTASNLVLRLNQDITLNLKRSFVLADEVLVATNTADGNQMELVNASDIQASLYHDTQHQSSVIVRARDGAAQVEGIINHKLRIKPVPEGKRSSQGEMLHNIYEVDVPTKIPINMGNGITRRNISKRELSYDRFAVEVHVISDSIHQKDFAKSEDLIAYFAVLINGVNLRYVDMTKPRIKFMLVGITRSLGLVVPLVFLAKTLLLIHGIHSDRDQDLHLQIVGINSTKFLKCCADKSAGPCGPLLHQGSD